VVCSPEGIGGSVTADDVIGETSDEARPEGPVSRVERQLATAQAITHMGSWEWNAQTNIVRWSDELYRIYGLAPQSCEITFDSFLGRLHPDDRERAKAAVASALERRARFSHPERIVRPDGSIRHLETVGEPAVDSAGQVMGLIGTCRDVTDEWQRGEQLRLHADIVRNVQIGLAVWSVGNPDDIGTVLLLEYNPAAEQLANRPLRDAVGRPLREIVTYAPGGQLESLILQVARDGEVREATVVGSRDAAAPNRSVTLKAFPLPGRCVGVAIEDITAQTLARRMAAAEQHVFEMTAEGAPLTDILRALAIAIEEQSPPTLVSIHLLDPDGKRVRHGAAPSLPEAYRLAIEGAPIGPKAGSCGTAAFHKRAVLVSDIEADERWDDYRDAARAAGLRACWSTPILATDSRVLGTFALYYREPRAPTERDLRLIARASHIAGIAIQRRQLEEELRALSGHLESAREEERTGIAREIHDELGQCLTAFKMDLAWIGRRASGAAGLPREALLEKVQAMSTMTDQIIDQVRRISSELRPGVLDDLGLLPALEWQGQEFERRTGLTCVIDSNLTDETALDRSLATAIFRVSQEALTNVARHGEATRVEIRLERRADWLELEVSDDGKGIAPEAASSAASLGLLGIRERARRLGGTATVSGAPSKGTTVSVRVPLREAAE
jgi:PAS domain S-box-containing protein